MNLIKKFLSLFKRKRHPNVSVSFKGVDITEGKMDNTGITIFSSQNGPEPLVVVTWDELIDKYKKGEN